MLKCFPGWLTQVEGHSLTTRVSLGAMHCAVAWFHCKMPFTCLLIRGIAVERRGRKTADVTSSSLVTSRTV